MVICRSAAKEMKAVIGVIPQFGGGRPFAMRVL